MLHVKQLSVIGQTCSSHQKPIKNNTVISNNNKKSGDTKIKYLKILAV